ncbi:hypothetical protein XENORESO_013728 [Xenotaenia resolanae]|uniref:Secreted protein n=1 Tax=Xenotaenia resolanae TaxID=208358 RepID=A0ABV0WYS0_9TELE
MYAVVGNFVLYMFSLCVSFLQPFKTNFEVSSQTCTKTVSRIRKFLLSYSLVSCLDMCTVSTSDVHMSSLEDGLGLPTMLVTPTDVAIDAVVLCSQQAPFL